MKKQQSQIKKKSKTTSWIGRAKLGFTQPVFLHYISWHCTGAMVDPLESA